MDRIEDDLAIPVLVWRLVEPELVISSGPLGGGIGRRGWAINATVPIGPMWIQDRFGAVSSSVKNFVWTPAPGGGRYYQDAQDWSLS